MRTGFTLVELAIVLVIIGLLVGGVLVGQDLIKAAEISAVISDIRSYNTSAAAFRTKYNGIPGDLLSTSAQAYGLTISALGPGTPGQGDGNGILQSGNGTILSSSVNALGGETGLFWRQLSDAQMIKFTSTATGVVIDTTNFATQSVADTALVPLIPVMRSRNSCYLHAGAPAGVNYFWLGSYYVTGNVNGWLGMSKCLTGREASQIDAKMDDASPITGSVLSHAAAIGTTASTPSGGGAPSAGNTLCYATVTGLYATSTEDIANSVRCGLRIKAGF